MTFKEALGVYKNSFCCMTSRIRSQPITAAKAVWKNKNKTKTKTNKKERKKERKKKRGRKLYLKLRILNFVVASVPNCLSHGL